MRSDLENAKGLLEMGAQWVASDIVAGLVGRAESAEAALEDEHVSLVVADARIKELEAKLAAAESNEAALEEKLELARRWHPTLAKILGE